MDESTLDYSEYIEIAGGVYWVGFADRKFGLHCNPYLITDGDEAVLIDSGSRNDFSTVMLKIMRTGISPSKIKRMIYQHYDPDLCANIPHMEAIINSKDLKIISHYENNIFINYYSAKSPKQCIEVLDYHYEFESGRRLEFIRTPYSHCAGSFITFDTKTKTLFTSDIFGSYDYNWDLFTKIDENCGHCSPTEICPLNNKPCQLKGILNFHKRVMTSEKALGYALDRIAEVDAEIYAPQHGSILHTRCARELVLNYLRELKNVGIDFYLEEGGRE